MVIYISEDGAYASKRVISRKTRRYKVDWKMMVSLLIHKSNLDIDKNTNCKFQIKMFPKRVRNCTSVSFLSGHKLRFLSFSLFITVLELSIFFGKILIMNQKS